MLLAADIIDNYMGTIYNNINGRLPYINIMPPLIYDHKSVPSLYLNIADNMNAAPSKEIKTRWTEIPYMFKEELIYRYGSDKIHKIHKKPNRIVIVLLRLVEFLFKENAFDEIRQAMGQAHLLYMPPGYCDYIYNIWKEFNVGKFMYIRKRKKAKYYDDMIKAVLNNNINIWDLPYNVKGKYQFFKINCKKP